jgi:hypothetical protein
MLYTSCKNYLISLLKDAGIRTKPFTSLKRLKSTHESHVGAVLFESEAIVRNGSKTIYVDESGVRRKRRMVFDRNLSFTIVIGEYTDSAVETIFDRFLALIEEGIYIEGNYVPIEIDGSDWAEDEDHILKAEVSAQVKITFRGGVHRETGFTRLSDVEIESLERKEPNHGSN